MCAHIGQNRDIYPPSIFRLHFRLDTPSPFLRRLTVGAAIEKNFFWFLFFWFARNPQMFGLRIFFSFLLFGFILDFIQNICSFNSLQVVTRHSSSASFYIYHVWISRFQILNFDSFLLASISTCFSIVDSMLWLFDSLSLWLLCLL